MNPYQIVIDIVFLSLTGREKGLPYVVCTSQQAYTHYYAIAIQHSGYLLNLFYCISSHKEQNEKNLPAGRLQASCCDAAFWVFSGSAKRRRFPIIAPVKRMKALFGILKPGRKSRADYKADIRNRRHVAEQKKLQYNLLHASDYADELRKLLEEEEEPQEEQQMQEQQVEEQQEMQEQQRQEQEQLQERQKEEQQQLQERQMQEREQLQERQTQEQQHLQEQQAQEGQQLQEQMKEQQLQGQQMQEQEMQEQQMQGQQQLQGQQMQDQEMQAQPPMQGQQAEEQQTEQLLPQQTQQPQQTEGSDEQQTVDDGQA